MATLTASFERIGHRGIPALALENTLSGIERAITLGADAIELDVHCTSDGVVVVHHDPDVEALPIARTPWSDLSEVVLADGSRVPTLAQVIELARGRARLYVELKGSNTEDRVLPLIAEKGVDAAVHSFDHAAIERCASRFPATPRGFLLDSDTPHASELLAGAARRTGARDVWPHHSLVTADFMKAAGALGLRVIAWTVNSGTVAQRLRELGVVGLCTDDVRILANGDP